jgi:4-amino-4-deoxy-L-arabinose transferase-like glycosyltransferase
MKRLFVILLIALALRTYGIERIPPSLSWDEVSIGYNAYSILKTGKDEHGKFLPLDTFIAYGDYKPPFAIYATVPFVALFGLNEFAVRLPSALFGTLTVLITFFLVKELFGKYRYSYYLSLLSSLLLAISPWHINLSRTGFEANIALFFVVLSVWLVLSARSYPRRLLIAWLPLVVSIYTFNSARYFSVFIAVALVVYIYSYIKKSSNFFITGVVIAFIFLIPIIPHILSKESRLRFVEVNIFTDSAVVITSNDRIAKEGNSFISKLINNRRVGYARSYFLHYLDNLQPDFLFVHGDGNPKFSIQDTGQLYLIEAPFLVLGILSMLVAYPGIAILLLYWIIVSIIPAATARETPHALRILNSLPVWQVFVGYGILKIFESLKVDWMRRMYVAILICIYVFSVSYYLHNYYRHYPVEFSGEWQYGYKQALEYADKNTSDYKKIYMSESIGRPYMYTLFYTKYDPEKYRQVKKSYFDSAGFYHVDSFDKFVFTRDEPVVLEKDALYIYPVSHSPQNIVIKKVIRLLNGDSVLTVYTKE